MTASLHVLTDEVLQHAFSHEQLAERIAVNGGQVVQYREKRLTTTYKLCSTAERIAKICQQTTNCKLIVNDRVDVAFSAKASGIHLGDEDLDPDSARIILGVNATIGRTANSLQAAKSATSESIDYLGVGPIFGTHSKSNPAIQLGLENLAKICQATEKPVIAIGNIQLKDVDGVIAAGASGIAVLSAIVCTEDPGKSTSQFVRALERCNP